MRRSPLHNRTLCVLAAACVASLLVTVLAIAPAPASARPAASAAKHGPAPLRIAWEAGSRRALVRALRSGTCTVGVRARGALRRVVVRLDGRVLARHRGKGRRAGRYRCTRRPRRLAPGTHALAATARDRAGNRARTRVTLRVPDERATPPAAASSAGTWRADFSTGSFSQWSWWGQGQSDLWGHISVVSPASEGIPAPTVGSAGHVGRMEVTPEDAAAGRIHAKLYKGFSENGRSPANVSGTYSAWYYVPSSYRVPAGTAVNVFQFKEKFDGRSDPLWWVQLSTGSWATEMADAAWVGPRPTGADQPVAMLNRWGNDWSRQVVFQTVPLDRWFEIRAELHQGDRIEFSIDGQPFDVARASEYPVSPFRADSQEWTFGAGNYGDAPGTVLYLGGASYSSR